MKTLFISDLDGTLLRSNKTISKEACEIINGLSEKGLHFSYATARSIYTSSIVTEGLHCLVPVITKNGGFVNRPDDWNIIYENVFTEGEALDIYQRLRKFDLDPIVFSIQEGKEKYSYDCTRMSAGTRSFVDDHEDDFRDNPLDGEAHILDGVVHYFSCIGTGDELSGAYQEIKDLYRCILSKDTYGDEIWLEIMPAHATKADAILQLKKLHGYEKVVVFGDGVNDIPMFQIADECYAVENAVPELKEIATGIILGNNEDGVAKWLEANYKRYL